MSSKALVGVLILGCALMMGCGRVRLPRSAPRQVALGKVSYEQIMMKNGLRIVVVPDPSRPVIATVLAIGAGGAMDPPGHEGTAHLLEHVTSLGRTPEGHPRKELLRQLGVRRNAFTHHDHTVYWSELPAEPAALAAVLRVELSRLATPLGGVSEADLAGELGVVANEILERTETPLVGPVTTKLHQLAFPASHPYARSVGGTLESIRGTSLADLAAYARQHYRPANAVLVVAGAIDADRLMPLLERAVPDDFPAEGGAPPARAPDGHQADIAPPAATARGLTLPRPVKTPQIHFGWPLPPSVGVQAWVNRYLADQLDSAMAYGDAVRRDLDVVSAGCGLSEGALGSLLHCHADLLAGTHLETTANNLLDAANAVSRQPVLADLRFKRQVAQLAVGMFLEAEELTTRATKVAAHYLRTGDVDYFGQSMAALDAVATPLIVETARVSITRERARRLVVRPAEGDELELASWPTRKGKELPLSPVVPAIDGPVQVFPPNVAAWMQFQLASGLKVLVAPSSAMPVVSLGLYLPAGRASASPLGLAEMALRLSHPPARRLSWLGRMGGRVGRLHDDNGLSFFVRAPAAMLVEALDRIDDEVGDRIVVNDPATHYKRDQLPHLLRRQEQPDVLAAQKLYERVFGAEHPLGRRRLDPALVDQATTSNVKGWIERALVPNDAWLVIAGDVDVAQIKHQVEDRLSGWKKAPRGADDRGLPVVEQPGRKVDLFPHAGTRQAVLAAGCAISGARPEDQTAREVAAEYLEAVLDRGMRRRGVSYGVTASASTYRAGGGALWLHAAVDGAALVQLVDALRVTLESPLQQVALSEAMRAQARSITLEFDSTSSEVHALLARAGLGRDPVLEVSQGLARLGALRPDAVSHVLETCARDLKVVLSGAAGPEAAKRLR